MELKNDTPSIQLKSKNLFTRCRVIQLIRNYFFSNRFLEVETPCRIPDPTPESYIDALPSGDKYLMTSPELYMKRLLAAGFDKIFQICKCFRSDEFGQLHLGEFTMLEWYRCHKTYCDMMIDCENLICHIADGFHLNNQLQFQEYHINIKPPWNRISVNDAFSKFASICLDDAIAKNCFEEIMVNEIEPQLPKQQPVFLYDYPPPLAALSRIHPKKNVAERFELYFGGIELCNAFSELTDKTEQKKRFILENEIRQKRGKEPYPISAEFLDALPSMPECTGNALGVDRLVMLFTNQNKIQNVVSFY